MSSATSQNDLLDNIARKLDLILAFLAVRGLEDDQGAMVKKLDGLGMNAKTIAAVVGLSENAVKIRLHRLRKQVAVNPRDPASG